MKRDLLHRTRAAASGLDRPSANVTSLVYFLSSSVRFSAPDPSPISDPNSLRTRHTGLVFRRSVLRRHVAAALALYLAERPPRSAASGLCDFRFAAGRQIRHHRHSLFLQMGDGCPDRAWRHPSCLGLCRWARSASPFFTAFCASAMALFTQARDAVFADVAMHAVRRLAKDVFVHLHQLSLALSSRAQDRRPDPHSGTRPQCDRDHHPHHRARPRFRPRSNSC